MTIKHFRMRRLITTIAVVVTTLAAACGGSTPQAVEIPVTVEAKTMNPGTIRVKQGDMVTLKIDAEDDGEYHIHGYDIEQNIDGDAVASFYFVADATGRFKITFHHSKKGDDEDKEGNHGHEDREEGAEFDIGFLEVGPR